MMKQERATGGKWRTTGEHVTESKADRLGAHHKGRPGLFASADEKTEAKLTRRGD